MTRILVVEDEPGIALALEDDLRLEGYEVEVTGDGTVAVRKGRDGRFDLILLDIMLTGKDGLDVCRELRRDGTTTPIIMLTARTQEAGEGASPSSRALTTTSPSPLAHVNCGPHRGASPPGETSAPRPPSCASATRTSTSTAAKSVEGRVSIPLTPIEFRLLQLFVRAQGRILTRDQLIDGAWGPGTSISDRVVDNHIGSWTKARTRGHRASLPQERPRTGIPV